MKKLICSVAIVSLTLPIWAIVHCEFAGAGEVASVSVNFEDPDGDCISDNYEVFHYMNNGSVNYTPWPEPGQSGVWGNLDFNTWDCCKPT
ncbi:MAG: hypothetical protein K9J37_03400 [Saprospiraceae bacterium]|nr:hypothetical protein [Saprospiraceae bacterium]MCF8248928.1 hypothetical protein [Saprospiraceae bacterium]MCF8279139.1 hypothetical protein [Bacteroidales bacterium]MCF8310822.1 hypothetical protein [Saprospiraceae bacterium]MCF8439590.1 hypothetical protein [Saprospiraceae bacterium]